MPADDIIHVTGAADGADTVADQFAENQEIQCGGDGRRQQGLRLYPDKPEYLFGNNGSKGNGVISRESNTHSCRDRQ